MIKKLKHKTISELFFRLFKAIKDKLRDYLFNLNLSKRYFINIKSRQEFLQNKNRPFFFFDPDRRWIKSIFANEYHSEYSETIKRAEKFLNLEFRFLGKDIKYQNKIDWHTDPITGHKYPQVYFRKVDIFTNDELNDIKYIWEINRHQFFIDLSKAFFLTGDEKYAQKVIELFYDWTEKNRYKIGVNWTSALEVAVRAYAWIWSLYLLLDSDLVDDQFVGTFLNNIYLHGQYLAENLSFYFSPYNHLVGETSALFLIGYLFPELKESKKWARKSWKILQRELGKQFHSDGMAVEQASFYHYFTLGFFLLPVILRKQNKEKISSEILNHLKRIFDFSMCLTQPNGETPAIGDIDNARSIYFSDPENWDFRNFLAIGAILFNSKELKFKAGKKWEDLIWLFGKNGLTTFQKIPTSEPQSSITYFNKSGYILGEAVNKPGSHYFLVDVGPISAGIHKDEVASAAHGHADILSFILSGYGENFIIDPGFSNYRGEFEWHKYFRETKAHNTIVIDGVGQAKHGKILFWSHASEPEVIIVEMNSDYFYVCATHDGFRGLPDTPKHYRHFLFLNEDVWLVFDDIKMNQSHLVESFLHFSPGKVEGIDDRFTVSRNKVKLNILFLGDKMEREIKQGGTKPDDGWISPLYREKEPAPLLRSWHQHQSRFQQVMVFIPQISDSFQLIEHGENRCSFISDKSNYFVNLAPDFSDNHIESFRVKNGLMNIEWNRDNGRVGLFLGETSRNTLKFSYYEDTGKSDKSIKKERIFEY